eukprot:scaffold44180_cov23-Tisochrysis_lutea.AAC.1
MLPASGSIKDLCPVASYNSQVSTQGAQAKIVCSQDPLCSLPGRLCIAHWHCVATNKTTAPSVECFICRGVNYLSQSNLNSRSLHQIALQKMEREVIVNGRISPTFPGQ